MSLYIYISSKCEEEARSYHLEEHLYQLKNRVEQEQSLTQFEVFEYPYQVKKRIGYNYRLLTRLCYVEVDQKKYRVLVFLKLYNRGDKDYSLLYINAKARGDFIYQQQNIDPYLQDYVQQRLTQKQITAQYAFSEQDLLYLQHSRINVLNLQQQLADDYYVESSAWRYQIRPQCTVQDFQHSYQHLFDALEQQQSQYFQIQSQAVEFLKHDAHYQLGLKDEFSTLNNKALSHQMLLDEPTTASYDRYAQRIPADVLLDENQWLLTEQLDLPFCLNEFQQNCIDLLFHQHEDYPVLINAGKNVGKTTLLALLYVHFLQQNHVPENTLPCLFLVSPHEVVYLRQQIQHYIALQQHRKNINFGFSDDQLSQLLTRSCISLNDLILQQFSPQQREKFKDDFYISEMRFNRLWHKHFHEHDEAKSHYSASLCWYVIHYLIKGYSLDQEHAESAQVVAQLSMISPEIFQKIEEHVWKAWYQPLCENEGYWDDQDLIVAAYDAEISLPHYCALLCDHSHHLSRNAMQFILHSAIWLKKPIEDHIYDAPLIFMGQHSASYPTSLLTWYREMNSVLQQNIQLDKKNISKNSLTATIRDYSHDHRDDLGDLDAHLQEKRQNLHILKSKIRVEFASDDIADVEILFISTQDEEIIQQILIQENNALILNCLVGKQNRYLKSTPPFSQIFKLLSENQIQQASYCLNHLPKKSHSVVLSGFYHHSFAQLQQNQIEQLNFSERYHMDYRLNLFQQACQQGLKRIFIVGENHEFETWKALFSVDVGDVHAQCLNPFQFRRANLADLCPDFAQQQKAMAQLEQQEKLALEKQDAGYLRDLAQRYFDLKAFQKYWQLRVYADDIEQKYADYFQFCQTDEQKEYMVQWLWVQQKPHLLLQYQKYFPVALAGNALALLLANERIFRQDYSAELLKIAKQYQRQQPQPVWYAFWHILLEKILNALMATADSVQQNWSTISEALALLKQLNFAVPAHLMAYSAYQCQDVESAHTWWDIAKETGEIQDFPKEYYTLNLTTAEDVPARLSCLIALGQTEQLMNELNQLNLNELQTEYWEQILEYLHDEDELKPVLKQLLPSIHSQEVLEKLYRFCKNHTSDKFALRVQRFKTLQACLNSDWEIVADRLAHYIPIQDEKVAMQKLLLNFSQVSKARVRQKKNTNIQFNEELIEILYALNLNSDLYVPQGTTEFKHYAEDDGIRAVFDAIRKNFAFENDKQEVIWKINFSAVRSLCYLLEKSPNPLDALHLYQNMIDRKQKDALFDFSVERLFTLIQRLKFIDDLDETVQKKMGQLEIEHKKLFQSQQLFDIDLSFDLPVIKTQDEIVKSILALSNQENAEIQKVEREEALELAALEQAEKEAELKRLFDLAEQQKQQQEADEQAELERQQQEREQQLSENEAETKQDFKQQDSQQNIIAQDEVISELKSGSSDVLESVNEVLDSETTFVHEDTQEIASFAEQAKELNEQHPQDVPTIHLQPSDDLLATEDELQAVHPEIIPEQANENQHSHAEKMVDVDRTVQETAIFVENTLQNHQSAQKIAIQPTSIVSSNLQSRKAITEFEFFGARIFVSRTHQRINIEDIETGERWSLHLKTGKVQSDWDVVMQDQYYHLAELRLMVAVTAQKIQLQQLDHGIELSIQL